MRQMRRLVCASLLFALVLSLVAGPATADEGQDISVRERLGEVRLFAPAAAVKKLLGAPLKKGKVVDQGADGSFVQRWEYPVQGLSIEMAAASRKGPQKVASIGAQAPCALKTARGIGIGSTAAEVAHAYGAEKNAEESTAERFVAGSVYGGVLFGLKEGRVETIFLGAAAE
jgi:hypothetical protein